MADYESSMSAEEVAEDESEQVLIPRSFFAGKDLKIGSKCKIKVEALYDDEVSVSYVKHVKKKDGDKKDKDKDSDDDDDDDKPKRHHHHSRDDSDLMRERLYQMEAMAQPAPAPAPGGYY